MGLMGLMMAAMGAAGAEVWFVWRGNPEPDIAGYYLHHGPASRGYTNRIDVGLTTNCMVELTGRQFIALSAYNTQGAESDFSRELEYVPVYVVAEWSVDFVTWQAVSTNEVRQDRPLEFWRVRVEREE